MLNWLRASCRCPVCARAVREFLPLPPEYERNARKHGYPYFGMGETINVRQYSCPQCGASDRERLCALFLQGYVPAPSPDRPWRLLHFAPEPALSRYLRGLGRFDCRTADLAPGGADDRVDITRMELYADARFDAFICSHVLEHVQDDFAALRELHRVLKPGGWGILMVPLMPHLDDTLEDPLATTEAERWRLFGQGDHVRLYAKRDFLRRIESSGFRVEQFGVDRFGPRAFERCGITPSSVLYVARKPS